MPATAQTATSDPTPVASDACPLAWPVLRSGPPVDQFDGAPSVLVGGNLTVGGAADGAEGIVVARGNATFIRDVPGTYRIGTTASGSQVAPHAGSDMLSVGGDLVGDPGTVLDIGQGLGADAVLGGTLVNGTLVDLHGGTLDGQIAGATSPYDALIDGLAAKSASYAARALTGTVEITDATLTLTGDGSSDPQTFAIDGAALATGQDAEGRALQLVGVPDGAAVIVNLSGPSVDLDLDSLLAPDGATVDPTADPYFAQLASHLLWNVTEATSVDIGGEVQLPGSLLVATPGSVTSLDVAGTNGRTFVAGDLVHRGGELHSYPFLLDPDLDCGPALTHVSPLSLTLTLEDPAKVIRKDPYFQGTFSCIQDGVDVTPGDGLWRLRATGAPQLLSGLVPVGALCFIGQELDDRPPKGWQWVEPEIFPSKLAIVKRESGTFSVTNRLQQVKAPPIEPDADADPNPTIDPTPDSDSDPDATTNSPPDSVQEEPTRPTDPPVPTAPDVEPPSIPNDDPSSSPDDTPSPPEPAPDEVDPADGSDDGAALADPPRRPNAAGPLTTTAPYTLRGAFVWGPLLLISVLAMRLRFPWRPRKRNQEYY